MEAEDNWNCQLTNVSHTARDGKTFLFSFRCFVSLSLSFFLSDAKMYSLTLLYRRLRTKGKHSSLENCYFARIENPDGYRAGYVEKRADV